VEIVSCWGVLIKMALLRIILNLLKELLGIATDAWHWLFLAIHILAKRIHRAVLKQTGLRRREKLTFPSRPLRYIVKLEFIHYALQKFEYYWAEWQKYVVNKQKI